MTTTSEPGTSWSVLKTSRSWVELASRPSPLRRSTTDTGGICDANVDNAPANVSCRAKPGHEAKSTALRARLSMSTFWLAVGDQAHSTLMQALWGTLGASRLVAFVPSAPPLQYPTPDQCAQGRDCTEIALIAGFKLLAQESPESIAAIDMAHRRYALIGNATNVKQPLSAHQYPNIPRSGTPPSTFTIHLQWNFDGGEKSIFKKFWFFGLVSGDRCWQLMMITLDNYFVKTIWYMQFRIHAINEQRLVRCEENRKP
jgi:hypothetical protein